MGERTVSNIMRLRGCLEEAEMRATMLHHFLGDCPDAQKVARLCAEARLCVAGIDAQFREQIRSANVKAAQDEKA